MELKIVLGYIRLSFLLQFVETEWPMVCAHCDKPYVDVAHVPACSNFEAQVDTFICMQRVLQ